MTINLKWNTVLMAVQYPFVLFSNTASLDAFISFTTWNIENWNPRKNGNRIFYGYSHSWNTNSCSENVEWTCPALILHSLNCIRWENLPITVVLFNGTILSINLVQTRTKFKKSINLMFNCYELISLLDNVVHVTMDFYLIYDWNWI